MWKLSKSLLIVLLVVAYSELEMKPGQCRSGTLAENSRETRGNDVEEWINNLKKFGFVYYPPAEDPDDIDVDGSGSGNGNTDDEAHPENTDDLELGNASFGSGSGNDGENNLTFDDSPNITSLPSDAFGESCSLTGKASCEHNCSQGRECGSGALSCVKGSAVGLVIGVMLVGHLI